MTTTGDLTTAGFDIGYGNGKCVARTGAGDPVGFTLPVGAAPASKAGKTLQGGTDFSQGVEVYMGGTPWIAGVDPTLLQGGFARQTHDEYVMTPEYKALALALMAKLGKPCIDYLVTGLPCSHYLGSAKEILKAAIVKQLVGDHSINARFRCQVKNVLVTAQPVGSYIKALSCDDHFIDSQDALTLICDIGYGTADWCVLQGSRLWDSNSGSSLDATSRILELAAMEICKDNPGAKLSPDRLESLYRRGEVFLDLAGRKIPFMPYLEMVGADVSRSVMAEVASSMRTLKDSVSQVLLTGGGARLFERAARETFKAVAPAYIKVDSDPVLGNATGFQIMAEDTAMNYHGQRAA
jgi:plasmid segregation protein ParM